MMSLSEPYSDRSFSAVCEGKGRRDRDRGKTGAETRDGRKGQVARIGRDRIGIAFKQE